MVKIYSVLTGIVFLSVSSILFLLHCFPLSPFLLSLSMRAKAHSTIQKTSVTSLNFRACRISRRNTSRGYLTRGIGIIDIRENALGVRIIIFPKLGWQRPPSSFIDAPVFQGTRTRDKFAEINSFTGELLRYPARSIGQRASLGTSPQSAGISSYDDVRAVAHLRTRSQASITMYSRYHNT